MTGPAADVPPLDERLDALADVLIEVDDRIAAEDAAAANTA